MYQLSFERFEYILVARLIGDLTLPNAVSLRQDLEQAVLQEKAKDIIFDLSTVEKADNSGLGVLVAISTFARSEAIFDAAAVDTSTNFNCLSISSSVTSIRLS